VSAAAGRSFSVYWLMAFLSILLHLTPNRKHKSFPAATFFCFGPVFRPSAAEIERIFEIFF